MLFRSEQAERELGLRPEGPIEPIWPVPEADEEDELTERSGTEGGAAASDSEFVSRSSDRGGPAARAAPRTRSLLQRSGRTG